MSAWQSFIVAWVAAQLIPVVLEEPSFPVFLGAVELVTAFVMAFSALNLLYGWIRGLLPPVTGSPVRTLPGGGGGATPSALAGNVPLGSGFSSSPTVTSR